MVLRWELIASVVLHGAVLVMAFGAFWTVPASPPSKPVAVSIVKLSESSQLKSGRKFAESEEGVAGSETAPNRAAKAEAVIPSLEPVDTAPREQKTTESIKQAALPPPKQAGLNAQEPPPQDISEETAHGVPIPVRAQRPQPRYQERWQKPSVDVAQTRSDQIAGLIRKPSKQVARREDAGRFDPERIAALLNRTPNTRPEPRESEEQNTNTPWRYPHSLEEQMARALQNDDLKQRIAYGASDGRDNRMSANDIDAFRAQISRCWRPPVSGLGGNRIVVKLRIGLRENGSLAHAPAIANHIASPFFRPAAESALRAVVQCQPYRMPAEKFDQWRDMLLTFDPRQMYGG